MLTVEGTGAGVTRVGGGGNDDVVIGAMFFESGDELSCGIDFAERDSVYPDAPWTWFEVDVAEFFRPACAVFVLADHLPGEDGQVAAGCENIEDVDEDKHGGMVARGWVWGHMSE